MNEGNEVTSSQGGKEETLKRELTSDATSENNITPEIVPLIDNDATLRPVRPPVPPTEVHSVTNNGEGQENKINANTQGEGHSVFNFESPNVSKEMKSEIVEDIENKMASLNFSTRPTSQVNDTMIENMFEDQPEIRFDDDGREETPTNTSGTNRKGHFFALRSVKPLPNVSTSDPDSRNPSQETKERDSISLRNHNSSSLPSRELEHKILSDSNTNLGKDPNSVKGSSNGDISLSDTSKKVEVELNNESMSKDTIKETSKDTEENDRGDALSMERASSNSSSASPNIISSYLSPVPNTVSFDDSFIKSEHNESADHTESADPKNAQINYSSDDSEAETEVAHSPPRLTKARELLAKSEREKFGTSFRRSKTVVESSDEENVAGSPKESSEGLPKTSHRPYKIKRDSSGRSLLQRACKKGNLEEVKRLISKGASPNEADFCGFTCLHEAALEGHVEIVKLLIDRGADINKQALQAGDLETPLIDAAENKHYEIVKLLLENGADPRIFNIDGFTALTKIFNNHADEEGYDSIIKLLEEYHSRVADTNDEDKNLDMLSYKSSPSPLLAEDPNDTYFSELLKKKSMTSGIYKLAAEGAKAETANYFIEGGLLDFKPDILFLAARNGHKELVDIILGLNPSEFDINEENKCGITVLLASVGRGHYEVVKFLLEKGANPRMKRKQDGLNAVEIAERSPHYDSKEIKLLHKYVKDSNSDADDDQKSEIEYTIKQEDTSPVEAFDADNNDSETARKRSSTHVVEDILHLGKKGQKKMKVKETEIKVKVHPSSLFSKDNTPEQLKDHNRVKQSETLVSEHPVSIDEKKSLHRKTESRSLSPSPVTAMLEEQKAKSAEQARIWQEKMEAKKKARKDMFLKLEKEKERKRIEDEQRKREEEKILAIKVKEEQEKLEEQTEKESKNIESKKHKLIVESALEHYPLGLRFHVFGKVLKGIEMEKFLPLYLFSISDVTFVTDLQMILLTGSKASDLMENLPKDAIIEASKSQKSRLWSLFYPMIAVEEACSYPQSYELVQKGHIQFQSLMVRFLKLEFIEEKIKLLHPQLYSHIWEGNRKVKVSLDSLTEFSALAYPKVEIENKDLSPSIKHVNSRCFIPPLLKIRKDALKTIHDSKAPLW